MTNMDLMAPIITPQKVIYLIHGHCITLFHYKYKFRRSAIPKVSPRVAVTLLQLVSQFISARQQQILNIQLLMLIFRLYLLLH